MLLNFRSYKFLHLLKLFIIALSIISFCNVYAHESKMGKALQNLGFQTTEEQKAVMNTLYLNNFFLVLNNYG